MIKGIGTDIIEIGRIRTSIQRHGLHFLNRLFSQKEQDYGYQKFADPLPHFAGRFAAKEAVAKALGTGFGSQLSWLDFEIINDDQGRPLVQWNESASQRFQNPSIHLSISHCTEYAIATAIWTHSKLQ